MTLLTSADRHKSQPSRDPSDAADSVVPTRGRAFHSLLLICLTMLGCSGDFSAEAPALKAALKSSDVKERNQAALRAASFGPAAKELTPELTRLLRDRNGGVRSSAAYALRAIDTPEARRALDTYTK